MKPMLDCDAVMRQLWDYLDGELTEERVQAIREHVEICGRCHPQLEFERTFLGVLARVRREHSDPGRLRERVLSALREEGFAAGV
ncbi:MAG TPA: zf-HC2 domain-containing protein [Gemmatimonadaceae bacterium]|nr:zf-HC2 domain-containing protein [Gemmatimonadaceae bacterium]